MAAVSHSKVKNQNQQINLFSTLLLELFFSFIFASFFFLIKKIQIQLCVDVFPLFIVLALKLISMVVKFYFCSFSFLIKFLKKKHGCFQFCMVVFFCMSHTKFRAHISFFSTFFYFCIKKQ